MSSSCAHIMFLENYLKCPLTPKYFSVCFLKLRLVSCIVLCATESAPTFGNYEYMRPTPQCAALNSPAQLLGILHVASVMSQSISHLVFLFSCCLQLSPPLLSFLRNPPHDVPDAGWLQFHHFVSSNVSGLLCSWAPLLVFLAIQSSCKALLQHCISNESVFVCFSCQPSSLSNFCNCIQ